MTLTNFELAAVLKLGIDMLMADGRVDENEKKIIAVEMMKFGVTGEKLAHLGNLAQAMQPAEAIATVSTFDDEKKKHVAAFLAFIMISDGDIDDSEIALWRLISTLASLPTMTIKEGAEHWRKWLQK